jgi:DNA-directed RNA polymerase subunit omega
MIEGFKGDEIVKKVGGRFRLAALIQRRLKEIIEGSRPLVDTQGKTPVEIVVDEIMLDKITIDYDRTQMLEKPDKKVMDQQIQRG